MKKVMLDINQAKEGMVTSKDTFTDDGILLIPSHTTLTPANIVKMSVYNIHNISVYVEEAYKGPVTEDPLAKLEREFRLSETQQEKEETVTDTVEFREFTKDYDHQIERVESQLSQIIHTGKIETEPLHDLVANILSTTAASSQLFSFMCRLRNSDDTTYSHSMNVCMLASFLGKWLHLPPQSITELALAGLIHDIGKVLVDQDILNKQGPLTTEEFDHIKKHTTLGYELVADSPLPLGVKHAVLMHHEKMNGIGYPLGLGWERIHQYAKIISVVDIYDAMTSERPYHKRFHPFHVIRIFEEECYGVLDTDILYVFLERIAHNFMNDKVRLDDGSEAEIIFIHHRNPSRPIVELSNGKIIDLQDSHELDIADFL